MELLMLIGWVVLAILLFTGILRVIFRPYTGMLDFILELLLLDLLIDLLAIVLENIGDLFD